MAFTSDINSLMKPGEAELYKAKASITDGSLDASTTSIAGDTSGGLFTDEDNGLKKDDFLRLLVTQLQYQDPLSPMDNKEFVSQLAQFKAMESNQNIESAIGRMEKSYKDSLSAQQYSAESMSNASAVSLIGKEVLMKETYVTFYGDPKKPVPISVHMGARTEATVRIVDADGEIVRTLEASGKDARNAATVHWDGRKDDGSLSKSGRYGIMIDGAQSDPSLYAFVQDTISGVRFTDEGIMLKAGGKEMSIGNVMDVSTRPAASSTGDLSFDSAVSLIGKRLRIMRETVTYNGKPNEQLALKVNLGNFDDAIVEIVDRDGEVVARVPTYLSEWENGSKTVVWDGSVLNSGDKAEAGVYSVRVVDTGSGRTNPDLYVFSEGVVDSVNTAGGTIQVRINGTTVPIEHIIDVSADTPREEIV